MFKAAARLAIAVLVAGVNLVGSPEATKELISLN